MNAPAKAIDKAGKHPGELKSFWVSSDDLTPIDDKDVESFAHR